MSICGALHKLDLVCCPSVGGDLICGMQSPFRGFSKLLSLKRGWGRELVGVENDIRTFGATRRILTWPVGSRPQGPH